MSRTVISVVVAGVIVALTAIAFFVASTSYEERARKDSAAQLRRAFYVIQRLNQLQSIDVLNKAERLASQPCEKVEGQPAEEGCRQFVKAINASGADRARLAQRGFQGFDKEGAVRPDIMALVDSKGELLAMHEVSTVVPKQWIAPRDGKQPAPAGEGQVETIIPALNIALRQHVIVSDSWYHGDRMLKVGVAPVIDVTLGHTEQDQNIVGAVVIAYAQTSKSAQQDKALLGTEIAYYDGNQVVASSFTREPGGGEDTSRVKQLSELVVRHTLADGKIEEIRKQLEARDQKLDASQQQALKQQLQDLQKQKDELFTIDGTDYLAATVKLPRAATKALPDWYPSITAGAVVLSPIQPSPEAWTVKLFVIVLGLGSLAIAMLGVYLAHRRLVAQIDQVEIGVTDIINGNVDRTFRPVGEELEGLSNGLNVMLARLLGRPEPGEEELDDDGNPIIPGRVEFEDGEGEGAAPAPATDPDLAALARESEPDYYKRVYTEYLAAKRATGHPDDVSFENFIAKLKVNEGKLRAQYQCRAVRFRVVTKDGKVSLKPVPIFA